MGSPSPLRRPQPRGHCTLRCLLHLDAYSEPATAQICNPVRILSYCSACFLVRLSRLLELSLTPLQEKGVQLYNFLHFRLANCIRASAPPSHRINVRCLRHTMILHSVYRRGHLCSGNARLITSLVPSGVLAGAGARDQAPLSIVYTSNLAPKSYSLHPNDRVRAWQNNPFVHFSSMRSPSAPAVIKVLKQR